jgi:hypothetical protein
MTMRLLPAVLLALGMSWTASGQTYTISTFAGNGIQWGHHHRGGKWNKGLQRGWWLGPQR